MFTKENKVVEVYFEQILLNESTNFSTIFQFLSFSLAENDLVDWFESCLLFTFKTDL